MSKFNHRPLGHGRKIQKGIFTYLKNRGLTAHQMRWCIKQYAVTLGKEIPNRNLSTFYDETELLITEDFASFKRFIKKTFITEVGGHHQLPHSNEHWNNWEEKNLDGSFAYNGVTDDF